MTCLQQVRILSLSGTPSWNKLARVLMASFVLRRTLHEMSALGHKQELNGASAFRVPQCIRQMSWICGVLMIMSCSV